jgi:hypothetical protein
MDWNCNSPTLAPEEVIKDRLQRLEARATALRELDVYLSDVRSSDRTAALLLEATQ